MAQNPGPPGPYEFSSDDGGDGLAQTRRRIPRPGEVVAGTPGEPGGMQSHGIEGWDTTGRGNQPPQPRGAFDYHDYLSQVQPPTGLPDLGTRPVVSMPQVGRQGSILGAVTGAVGGSQALKQHDWDTQYGARLGGYQRQVELAKLQQESENKRLAASNLRGVAGQPLVQYDTEGNITGVQASTPGGGREFIPGVRPSSTANAGIAGQSRESVANIGAGSRENVANINAGSREAVADTAAKSRVTAAQVHATAAKTGKPAYFVFGDKLAQVNPDGSVQMIEGSEGATKPPAAERPDTTKVTTGLVDPLGKPAPPKIEKTTHPKPKGSPAPQLTDIHVNPKTGQRIGRGPDGQIYDAATGKLYKQQ